MTVQLNWPFPLELHDGVVVDAALTVFPLVGGTHSDDYLTLEQAQGQDLVFIAEQQRGARVPEIEVNVCGEKPVLIFEGELLEGAFQNRVVDITLLLPPGRHHVPVNCVEAGRWRTKARTRDWYAQKSEARREEHQFEATGTTLDAAIRREKLHSTVANLHATGRARSNQRATWAAIDRKLQVARVKSSGSDLLGLYEARWSEIGERVERASPLAGQVGAVVAVGGAVVAIETVDSPATWQNVWRKVICGYVSEALDASVEGNGAVAAEDAASFVHKAASASWQQAPSPTGLGRHATLERPLIGFTFSAVGAVRHAVVFSP